jgi:hypothetical protein
MSIRASAQLSSPERTNLPSHTIKALSFFSGAMGNIVTTTLFSKPIPLQIMAECGAYLTGIVMDSESDFCCKSKHNCNTSRTC